MLPGIIRPLLALCLIFKAAMTVSCSETTEAKNGRLTNAEPANGATQVPVDVEIVLTFSEQLSIDSIAAPSEETLCLEEHAVMLSSDGFITCLGLEFALVEGSSYRKLAIQPIAELLTAQVYELRLTSQVGFRHFGPLAETTISFTTAESEDD